MDLRRTKGLDTGKAIAPVSLRKFTTENAIIDDGGKGSPRL